MLEAVRAGFLPVLPNRLAYPELFDPCYLYEEGQLYDRLSYLLTHNETLNEKDAVRLTSPYDWRNQAAAYGFWFDV